MNLHELGVAEVLSGLARREFSSRELTQHLLTRITLHSEMGNFLCVNAESAMAQAAQADARLARGQGGPLEGVPIAHKDIFVTDFARTGLPTTAGSKILQGYASPFDATVVARLADRKSNV